MSMFTNGPVHLNSPEQMLRVLKELVADDAARWRGHLDVWQLDDQAPVWRLEVNDDAGRQVLVRQGDYLVLTYGQLLVVDADQV